MIRRGDLIRFNSSGRYATVIREPYTKRFMEAQDREMEAFGMGEFAGVWHSAIDVISTDNGKKRTIKLHVGYTVVDDEI